MNCQSWWNRWKVYRKITIRWNHTTRNKSPISGLNSLRRTTSTRKWPKSWFVWDPMPANKWERLNNYPKNTRKKHFVFSSNQPLPNLKTSPNRAQIQKHKNFSQEPKIKKAALQQPTISLPPVSNLASTLNSSRRIQCQAKIPSQPTKSHLLRNWISGKNLKKRWLQLLKMKKKKPPKKLASLSSHLTKKIKKLALICCGKRSLSLNDGSS